jgi:biofilm protein TabA
MALYGSLAALRIQAPRTPGFATAFAYLEELHRAGSPVQERVRRLAEGDVEKIDLGGGTFVLEQSYETKLRADGFFESHRKYIDVQTMLEGEELMEFADRARMKVRQPYNPDRDLIVYEDSTDSSQLRVFPGQAAIFFPDDVHMPTLRIRSEPVRVRKCVVKIPVG